MSVRRTMVRWMGCAAVMAGGMCSAAWAQDAAASQIEAQLGTGAKPFGSADNATAAADGSQGLCVQQADHVSERQSDSDRVAITLHAGGPGVWNTGCRKGMGFVCTGLAECFSSRRDGKGLDGKQDGAMGGGRSSGLRGVGCVCGADGGSEPGRTAGHGRSSRRRAGNQGG